MSSQLRARARVRCAAERCEACARGVPPERHVVAVCSERTTTEPGVCGGCAGLHVGRVQAEVQAVRVHDHWDRRSGPRAPRDGAGIHVMDPTCWIPDGGRPLAHQAGKLRAPAQPAAVAAHRAEAGPGDLRQRAHNRALPAPAASATQRLERRPNRPSIGHMLGVSTAVDPDTI